MKASSFCCTASASWRSSGSTVGGSRLERAGLQRMPQAAGQTHQATDVQERQTVGERSRLQQRLVWLLTRP
jgi:hypothetical protein